MRNAVLPGLLLILSPLIAAEPRDPAASAINGIGIDLLGRAAGPNENTVLSPYSIQAALAMTYAGAEGETREQMQEVLHYPPDGAGIHRSLSNLQQALTALAKRSEKIARESAKSGGPSDPIALTVANRLFAQRGYDFRPAYFKLLKDTYDAPLEQLDFAGNPAGAAKQINAWVEEQTRKRIRNLVPENAIGPLTRLVLVNAIYLKAPWAKEFSESATRPRPFHLAGGKTIEVPTMQRQSSLGHAKRDGYTAVTIPYSGGDLHFLVLLPDEAVGLRALESKLTPELLAGCANLPNAEVLLELPKFKLEPPLFRLGDTLEALGMKSAFDVPSGSANFNGIAPRRADSYLFISQVFHKTFIDVDEKGTEAAAATAVVMRELSARFEPSTPIEVRVDRPFLFAIQHRPSGACLFLGRVVNPGAN